MSEGTASEVAGKRLNIDELADELLKVAESVSKETYDKVEIIVGPEPPADCGKDPCEDNVVSKIRGTISCLVLIRASIGRL